MLAYYKYITLFLPNNLKLPIQVALWQAIELVVTQMKLEHHLSVWLQVHLVSQISTWVQCIGQKQLQYDTRNI